jgi:hypothetical protein
MLLIRISILLNKSAFSSSAVRDLAIASAFAVRDLAIASAFAVKIGVGENEGGGRWWDRRVGLKVLDGTGTGIEGGGEEGGVRCWERGGGVIGVGEKGGCGGWERGGGVIGVGTKTENINQGVFLHHLLK